MSQDLCLYCPHDWHGQPCRLRGQIRPGHQCSCPSSIRPIPEEAKL